MKVDNTRMDGLGLVAGIDGGAVAYGFSCQLAEVVKAVKETGKKGKVSITLTVDPLPKFGESAVALKANLALSVPRPDYKQMVKFALDDGTLIGDDPKQRKFEEISNSFKQEEKVI